MRPRTFRRAPVRYWENTGEYSTPKNEKTPEKSGVLSKSVAGAGFEDLANSAKNTQFSPSRAAIGAAVSTGDGRNPAERPVGLPGSVLAAETTESALLARLAAAWNNLSDADRAAVVEYAERFAPNRTP